MSSLYAVHVVDVLASAVVLDVWCIHEDLAERPLPNPALHGFFLRVLAESADPARPAALAAEGPFDDDAVLAQAGRFVTGVTVRSTASYPGSAAELPGVTYEVLLRDPRWAAHLRPGDRWDTAAYQTVAVDPLEPWSAEERSDMLCGLVPGSAREQIPALCQALSSYDADEVGAAIAALGYLGDPAAVPSLLVALGTHDPYARSALALALGRLGPPAGPAAEALRRILASEPAGSRARGLVGFALHRIAGDADGFEALRESIRPGADSEVREALLALDEGSLRRLVPDLLRAFAGGAEGDEEAEQLVYDLLALLAARGGAWAEPLRAAIERALVAENHNLRERAAEALTALGPPG